MTTTRCEVCGVSASTWVLHPYNSGGETRFVCDATECLYSLAQFSRHRIAAHTCLTCDDPAVA